MAQAELDRDEAREAGEPVETGMVKPPARIAALLDASPDEAMLCRRRLVRQDGEPSEVITWWMPAAAGRGHGSGQPGAADRGHPAPPGPAQGRAHRSRSGAGHRPAPGRQETKLLGVPKSAPILALYVTARDASGAPLLVLDIAMPGDRHELEDAYQIG